MMKTKISKKLAKGTVAVLNTVLRAEANSTSCFITYQPKVPQELTRFKRKK